MPYIYPQRRNELLDQGNTPVTSGELNFILTTQILKFLGRVKPKPRYEDYNAAIGALECCKLELYRRMISKYEDDKILENGDVY